MAALRVFSLGFLALTVAFAAPVTAGAKRTFDLPADTAERSIRRFAEQSGLEVFYPSSATQGVRTPAVTGEMTAGEALDAMLAGTDLIVVRVEGSRAFSLRRAEPGAAREATATAVRTKPPRIPTLASPAPPGISRAPLAPLSEVIVLSPFEVVSEIQGYHAANTMSGTRLNSKLDDLAAAITVVTKAQMDDFGLLDANDIFNYGAGTEGTGNYTDFLFNRNFEPVSNTELSPQTANRIRGLRGANTAWGNFETSGRVPIDPLNVDAVEISRGPNASIFGIGSPAGTVNSIPSTARLRRDESQISIRADSFGGHRSAIDLNRVLKRDVLALRGSAAHQHDGFDLKPSGLDTVRLNGMARYQPFKRTVLTGSYSSYRMQGNRPNATLPRETISGWIAAGRPTWDPIARTVKQEGVVVGTFPDSVPPVFTAGPQDVFANFFVDPHATTYVSAGRHTSADNPDVGAPGASFLANIVDDPKGFRTAQPLYAHVPSVLDRSRYDWTSINLAASNRVKDDAAIANVMWDQIVLDSPRHMLALQAGWFREQTDSYAFLPVGAPSNVATIAALHVDVNERRLDGTPNPNFLRPFFGSATPYHDFVSDERDTVRGQVAYRLDLRRAPRAWRWLGMHQLTGYREYKDVVTREALAYYGVVDQHSWLPGGVAHAGRGTAIGGLPRPGPSVALGYFRYYLGDTQGSNVDHAPAGFAPGSYPLVFGNPRDGFRTDEVAIGQAFFAAGNSFSQRTVVKSRGAILQSHLFEDRLVTTIGLRNDRRFSRSGNPFRLQPDGVTIDHAATDGWAPGDWNLGEGPTRTAGVVVKPLPWLSLHANRSDSFQPEPVHQDLYLNLITDPMGEGKDFGFSLNVGGGKLQVRLNQYKTVSREIRGATVQNLANRVRNIDFVYDYSLQKKAEGWFQTDAGARGAVLSPHELSVKVADLMGLPEKYLQLPSYPIDAVHDIEAEGTEVEVHFNPTQYWTVAANFNRQEAVGKNIAPEINRWINERIRVWEKVIDPTTGRPWFTEPYSPFRGGQSPKDYLDVFVLTPLKLAQAQEGMSLPQIRKHRVNVSSRLALAGLTDQPMLKRFTVGGALRWESRGILGYHGLQQLPEIVTAFDASRPIWDRAHLGVDFFITFRAPFLSERVKARWQLNARNLTERGRLQPIAADPDGTPNAYRIVPPREFILSATFDF